MMKISVSCSFNEKEACSFFFFFDLILTHHVILCNLDLT